MHAQDQNHEPSSVSWFVQLPRLNSLTTYASAPPISFTFSNFTLFCLEVTIRWKYVTLDFKSDFAKVRETLAWRKYTSLNFGRSTSLAIQIFSSFLAL